MTERATPERHTGASASRDERRTGSHSRLAPGIVWSDLVAEMEAEWAAKRHERRDVGSPVVDLPESGAALHPPRELGDAA